MTGEQRGLADSVFLRDFAYLSSIGATPNGGVDREAATLPDAMQRAWLGGWLTSHGFDVRVDAIGNQFGLLDLVPGAPYILTGSHLDSQPTAGRFDGAYGVAASAHAAYAVARRAREGRMTPRHNLAVVNWFNEEGSRFAPSMMGSSVFTGKLPLESAYAIEDGRGVSVRAALELIGAVGPAADLPLAGYAEIHIEQGKELEDDAARIGVVTGTWGARKFLVTVDGEQAHTGPTAMADRRDALLGASLLVVRARELADELAHARLHTAVSKLDVRPNSPVVVARQVVCNLDLRSPDPEALQTAERLLREAAAHIEHRHGVSITLDRTHHWDRNDYPADGVELAEDVCAELGLTSRRVLTVAGHDSTNVKDVTPTVMLFVPSKDGISHNEGEFTTDDDMVAGLSVLTGVLQRLCAA
ncbi:M20 family metallo-hydrolase [Nonomuraea sp. NPDC049637]|uniref:M20 family metallo-hydrolase n=1 Tax=Nonomuraea sp. NPDC049637 TaxID=3154356 RepID=UPI00343DF675